MSMRLLVLSDLHLEFMGYEQPNWICIPCGDAWRRGEWDRTMSCHHGHCDICGRDEITVTTPDNCGGVSCGWNLQLPSPDAYDVVVLAGDIHRHTHGIHWAARTFPQRPVVMVFGNHEAYTAHWQGLMAEAKKAAARYPNIHLLDNQSVVIGDVRFLGTTLWTDFRLFGDKSFGDCLRQAKATMNDFRYIRFGTTGLMTPSDSVKLHGKAVAYLRDALRQPFDGKTVVVTHHLPSRQLVAAQYADDLLSAAFASNLDSLVEQADLWVAGHTHTSFDIRIGKCRCIVNPKGYPRWEGKVENDRFDSQLVVTV